MKKKINIISMRMQGHANASGYDRLSDFIQADVIHPIADWTISQRILCKALNFLPKRSGMLWYHRKELSAEMLAARKWFSNRNQIYHFLYGENCYRYLGTLNSFKRRNFIVSTYHTPPDKFRQVVRNFKHLQRLDAIIVVSRYQTDFFSELIGYEKVFYIPHGIDVEYFKPLPVPRDISSHFKALFVGSMLRDFETLAETARILARRDNNIRIAIVTPLRYHGAFKKLSNVDLFSDISDEKLLHFYQTSDLLLLPLLDGTANNTILEAMACGLPILSTRLPGIQDYVTDDCSFLAKQGDSKSLAEHILNLKSNELILKKMSFESRKQSENFSWQKIASRTMNVYQQISS